MGHLKDFDKDDLSNRIYPLTELIQKVAVKKRKTVKKVREEVCAVGLFSNATLCLIEGAYHGQRKPPRLQLKQELRLNDYFRKELEDSEIYISQMDLGLKVATS